MQKVTINGETFLATRAQATALDELMSTRAGGIAVCKGYVSTSDRIKPETADITFLSRFGYQRLLVRKIAALDALTPEDVQKFHTNEKGESTLPKKLAELDDATFAATMNTRREKLRESFQKTLDGFREDAHRQAHDRCYLRVCEGIRIHYKTVEVDKIKQPVTVDGLPVADAIVVDMLEVRRKIITPGEYKPAPNSGAPVLIENAMVAMLPKTMKFKALWLRPDNFESLHIDGSEMLPDEFKGVFD